MILKNLFSFLFISILVSGIVAQTLDTLTIQSEVTDDYKSYLDAKEDGWESKLLDAGEDDTSAKMNAHMGLALIRFARAQVDGEIMITDLDPIVIEIDDQITNTMSWGASRRPQENVVFFSLLLYNFVPSESNL